MSLPAGSFRRARCRLPHATLRLSHAETGLPVAAGGHLRYARYAVFARPGLRRSIFRVRHEDPRPGTRQLGFRHDQKPIFVER